MFLVLLSNGDRAEAEEPEGAVIAARTMMDDAADVGEPSVLLRASFYADGRLVRANVPRAQLDSGGAA